MEFQKISLYWTKTNGSSFKKLNFTEKPLLWLSGSNSFFFCITLFWMVSSTLSDFLFLGSIIKVLRLFPGFPTELLGFHRRSKGHEEHCWCSVGFSESTAAPELLPSLVQPLIRHWNKKRTFKQHFTKSTAICKSFTRPEEVLRRLDLGQTQLLLFLLRSSELLAPVVSHVSATH